MTQYNFNCSTVQNIEYRKQVAVSRSIVIVNLLIHTHPLLDMHREFFADKNKLTGF